MLVHRGGQKVKEGTYVGLATGEWVRIPKQGGILPGESKRSYLSMPVAGVAAPFLGLAYLIFLPLVGFVLGGSLMVRKGWLVVRGAVRRTEEATPGELKHRS
ncbi:MAG: hypothetical protein AB1597_01195 [Chloroflexota bacterium]